MKKAILLLILSLIIVFFCSRDNTENNDDNDSKNTTDTQAVADVVGKLLNVGQSSDKEAEATDSSQTQSTLDFSTLNEDNFTKAIQSHLNFK